jgi:RimJ/RimL family protein N-acetyltransferase
MTLLTSPLRGEVRGLRVVARTRFPQLRCHPGLEPGPIPRCRAKLYTSPYQGEAGWGYESPDLGHADEDAMQPTLTTDRLILRPHMAADLPACLALWSNPDVTRFIGGRPNTVEEVWRRILAYAGHWQLRGYGYWLATDRQTGAAVGEFGLADFQRDLTPSLGDTPEAGWAMLPQYQGRGLAFEALSAVLAWADATMPRTVCLIDPANTPSLRLAAKLGYTELVRTTYKDHHTILHTRPSALL